MTNPYGLPSKPVGQTQVNSNPYSTVGTQTQFGQPNPQIGQPTLAAPTFLQGVANTGLETGGKVLGALGWVLQPLGFAQQIFYGGLLDIVKAAQGEGFTGQNLMRGITSAGSLITYGAFDNPDTRAQNQISGSEIFKRFNASAGVTFWGGLASDIILDPANLVGGIAAISKLSAVGKIKKIENAYETTKIASEIAETAYKVGGLERYTSYLAKQGISPRPEVLQLLSKGKNELDILNTQMKVINTALEKAQIQYKLGERVVRLADRGFLEPVGSLGKQALSTAIAPVSSLKNFVSGKSATAVDDVMQILSQKAYNAGEAVKGVKYIGSTVSVGLKAISGKRGMADIMSAEVGQVPVVGGLASAFTKMVTGKSGVSVGEFVLPQDTFAKVMTGQELPSVNRTLSEGKALQEIAAVRMASRAAQTKLNQLGGVVAVATQKALQAFEPNLRKEANDAVTSLMASTTVGAYNKAQQGLQAIAAKSADPVRALQLLTDSYKAQVKFDMFGGTILQGIKTGSVERGLNGISPREYNLIAKQLDDATPETIVPTAERLAKYLDRKYGSQTFGLDTTTYNARGEADTLSSWERIRDDLIGASVGGRLIPKVDLAARATPITETLVKVMGREFAEEAQKQIDKAPTVYDKMTEAQKIVDEASTQLKARGLDPATMFRVDQIDDLVDEIEIMPSAIRRSFMLYGEYSQNYIDKLRGLSSPSELVFNPTRLEGALTRMQSPRYADYVLEGKQVRGLPTSVPVNQLAQDIVNFTQTGDFIRSVDRISAKGAKGEGVNLLAAVSAVTGKYGLSGKDARNIIQEILWDSGVVSKNARSSERLAAQLQTEVDGVKAIGSTGTLKAVSTREMLSEQLLDDMGMIRQAHALVREQEKVVGRVATERSVRLQMQQLTKETIGTYNLKNSDIATVPMDIRLMMERGEVVQLKKSDGVGVFKEGDLVPKMFARQLEMAERTNNSREGVGAILHAVNVARSWFSSTKLGTVASISRNIVGSVQMADQMGIGQGELVQGLVEFFKNRSMDSDTYKVFLETGVTGNTYAKTQLDMLSEIEVRKAMGIKDNLASLMSKYLGEQKGVAPGALSDNPNLQGAAKLGLAEILAGATVGTAVAPGIGTVAGAVAGATVGGGLGVGRKLFEVFGATEEMMRGAIYFTGVKRGLSPAQAADLAEESLYNYSARPIMAEVAEKTFAMPFATFASFSTVRAVEALYQRPIRLARAVQIPGEAERNQQADQEAKKAMPDWLSKSMPIPLPYKDSEGRTYYLPMKALVSIGGFEDLLSAVTLQGNADTDPFTQAPLVSLYKSVVTGQAFGGRKVYESMSADNLSEGLKNNAPEALRLALIETMNLAGYPVQAGSPFAQRVAKNLIPLLETNETIAKQFGTTAEEARQQVARWSAATLQNGIAIWGEGQYAPKVRPTQNPPRDPLSVMSQFIGLPLIPVQGDVGKPGEARSIILTGQQRIRDLEAELRKKLINASEEERSFLVDSYRKQIQEEAQKLRR